MARAIIGIAGEIASGKGTVAEYISKKYSASIYHFSTMIRDVLKRLYIEEKRENISKMSTMLRKNFGENLFAKVIAEDVRRDRSEFIVIDGVRRLDDIIYLKEIPEFKFIYVEADMNKCYERVVKRDENTGDRDKTFDQFKKECQLEPELRIKSLRQYADFILDNNGTLDELYKKIDNIINKGIIK
jgi:dephospho-CoA kinase